jgi:hypothetical protein
VSRAAPNDAPAAAQDRDKPEDLEQDDAHLQRQHSLGEGDGKTSVHGGDLLCAEWSGEDEQDSGAANPQRPRSGSW